ncbi:hypothetical protein LINPERHAP1_LOCUS2009 [Linum perenne]
MPSPVRPSDRPPEGSGSQLQIPRQESEIQHPPTSSATAVDFSFNRSYATALQGQSPSPNSAHHWIPVGEKDILLTVRDGIKSLNLSEEFKDKLCKPWSNTVVVRLLGKNIGYSYPCHRLHAIWKPLGNLHIVDLDRNCFLVKFANEQDYFKALTGGPWMLLDHYLIVHQWDRSFRVVEDLPKKMVVWVRFPHLPIHFYHPQVLTSLGNLLGRTIKIDFNTQRAERGKFARIAIEINLSEPLAPVIELDGALQKVEYENLPALCFECGMQAPEPGSYGPWMVVERRSRRSKKESTPIRGKGKDDLPSIQNRKVVGGGGKDRGDHGQIGKEKMVPNNSHDEGVRTVGGEASKVSAKVQKGKEVPSTSSAAQSTASNPKGSASASKAGPSIPKAQRTNLGRTKVTTKPKPNRPQRSQPNLSDPDFNSKDLEKLPKAAPSPFEGLPSTHF